MKRQKQRKERDSAPAIVGFVCNWGAYSGVEMAGMEKTSYSPSLSLVRVSCLGRLHLGILLRAFELGADGVMLLGCPVAECHYESGMSRANELYAEAKKVLHLLGIDPQRLALAEVPLGRGDILAKRVTAFARRIGRSNLKQPSGEGATRVG